MSQSQRINSLKANGCQKILIVAVSEYESLFIVKYENEWRFTNGDLDRLSFVGKPYTNREQIRIDAYNYAKYSWGFKDEQISDWVKQVREAVSVNQDSKEYHSLSLVKEEAYKIFKSDLTDAQKLGKLCELLM